MVEDVHDSIIDCEEKGLDFYLYEEHRRKIKDLNILV
jgi:hypothetical protein